MISAPPAGSCQLSGSPRIVDAEHDREHRDEVGDHRGGLRARGPDDVEVQDVGDARPERAEREDRQPRLDARHLVRAACRAARRAAGAARRGSTCAAEIATRGLRPARRRGGAGRGTPGRNTSPRRCRRARRAASRRRCPCHGASTTSTPAKPTAMPAIRSGVGGSSGSTTSENSSVISGVSELKMPASSEETSRLAVGEEQERRRVHQRARGPAGGRHRPRSRGSRSRVTARISSSAGAPNAQRRNAMCNGDDAGVELDLDEHEARAPDEGDAAAAGRASARGAAPRSARRPRGAPARAPRRP